MAVGSTFLVWNAFLNLTLMKWSGLSSSIGGGAATEAWIAIACGVVSCFAIGFVGSRATAKAVALISSIGLVSLIAFVMPQFEKLESFELLGPGPLVAGIGLGLAAVFAIYGGFIAKPAQVPSGES